MANIRLTLPAEPFSGQLVTFTAPCDCTSVSNGLVINGTTYTICDAMGNKVTGTGGVWCSGAQISVVLDCENKKAYLQNGKPTPDMIGAVNKSGDTMTGALTRTRTLSSVDYKTQELIANISNVPSACIDFYEDDTWVSRLGLSKSDLKVKLNGETDYKSVLHTGNYSNYTVKKSGGTMTGNFTIEKSNPLFSLNHTDGFGAGVQTFTNMLALFSLNDYAASTGGDYRRLNVYNPAGKASLADALSLTDKVGSTINTYPILHTGNMDSLLPDSAKVATGSYTGTGTYGESNPNSLTFDGAVKFLWIFAENSTGNHWTPHDASQHTKHAVSDCELTTEWVAGVGLGGNTSVGTDNAWGKKSADGKTVYWYSGTNASWQFNQPGAEYFYMAILE